MRNLVIDNIVIDTPIIKILYRLRLCLTNGKLREIKEKGDDIIVTCPHHNNGLEANAACNIYVGDDEDLPYGYFRCFVCEEKGTFLKFVQECFECSAEKAKQWLKDNFEYTETACPLYLKDDIVLHKSKQKNKILNPEVLNRFQDWTPYLAERKLSIETCRKFNVKYDPKTRQVIFPCYDLKGNLVMTPTRSIDHKSFYLDKNAIKPVYCLDYIVRNNIKSAIITEGPIDCLTGWEYGYPTCATLGRLSGQQIDDINKSGLNVLYLMFDNDTAGRSFTEVLKQGVSKNIILVDTKFPPGKKDLNDLSKEEFEKIMKNCSNSIEDLVYYNSETKESRIKSY